MGWINAGILAGFAALAIPIIIHLLRNLRYKHADLGTLRFLELAMQKSQRNRKLRELLLLIARLIIVALLVMLFARPFLEDPNKNKSTHEYVILLDASGTMAGKTAGTSNYALAKVDIESYLQKLPPNAKVTTAVFAEDVLEFKDITKLATKPAGKTDYVKAFKYAEKILKKSSRPKREVIMITDLQKNGLPDLNNLTADTEKENTFHWNKNFPVRIVPLKQAGDFNIAVTKVKNLTPYKDRIGPLNIDIEVYGRNPGGQIRIDVELEGPQVGDDPVKLSKTVDLQRSMVEDFKWAPKRTGQFKGIVKITPLGDNKDAYPRDNERHFVFVVREPHPILLVNGIKGKSKFHDETYFLQKALEVTPREGVNSQFNLEILPELREVNRYQTIALCNTKKLSKGRATELKEFVKEGGGLIYFLGSNTTGASCNMMEELGIFPAEFVRKRAPIPAQIQQWDRKHKAMELFADERKGDLRQLIFFEEFIFNAHEDATVLATLSNGNPAIIYKKVGKGHIIVVTNSATSRWVKANIFLPVVHELFTFLAGNRDTKAELKEKPQGVTEQRDFGVTKDKTAVIVPDARESDIEATSESKFRDTLDLGAAPEGEIFQQVDKSKPKTARRDDEIWLYLILGVLAMVVIENILADRGKA